MFHLLLCSLAALGADYASHPPIHPLPVPSAKPREAGPAYFVDSVRGNDNNQGSETSPWKSLQHGASQLKPGDTLYLRAGRYYEHATITVQGSADKPITIRSYPGELATIDGGLREFYESPETAWEPCPGGAPGEFRSTKVYPDLGGNAVTTNVYGHFADSMVPLHGYKYLTDLRSTNVFFNLPVNTGPEGNIYCGPGIFYDVTSGRIHVRLAHTKMKYLPAGDNYSGETDPRKLRLIIGGHKGGSTLTLSHSLFVKLQDLVVCGSREPTIKIDTCDNLEVDGLTVYSGNSCFSVKDSSGIRIINTACRGAAAPWTFRGSLKYRGIETRLFSASGWAPTARHNRDFEIAYSEFTDSVDGVFIGNVERVHFHHNLIENVTDDAIFLTAGTAFDGNTPGGGHLIHENLLRRCLTGFAFGVGHGRQKVIETGDQTGKGAHIYRNVFDFRRPVLYHQPRSADEPQDVSSKGRFGGDHGSPAWEPMWIYHNTILADDAPRYTYLTTGLGTALDHGTTRRVFNNIVVQSTHLPGATMPVTKSDFQADANLSWSHEAGPTVTGDLFVKFKAKLFAETQAKYPPGWGATDRFADPKFVKYSPSWKEAVDVRLGDGSPAIDSGVSLPEAWPDPLRGQDTGKPDLGALPRGSAPFHVGVHGRLTANGETKPLAQAPVLAASKAAPPRPRWQGKPAVIVEGYPAPDSPLFQFALERQGTPTKVLEQTWLPAKDYAKYSTVALISGLARAKVEPSAYTAEDLQEVDRFLRDGGTLITSGVGKDIFKSPEGQKYLLEMTGARVQVKNPKPYQVLAPMHPWIKHLEGDTKWVTSHKITGERAVLAGKGDRIFASPDGWAMLYRVPVGKGQYIHLAWDVSNSLPHTREKRPTVADERRFAQQMEILFRIAEELYPVKK